jgi:acyl carrier protein
LWRRVNSSSSFSANAKEGTLARRMHEACAASFDIDNLPLPSILTATALGPERRAPAAISVGICAFHQRNQMSDVNAQSVDARIAGVVRRLLAEHSIDRAVSPDEDLRQAGLSSLDMVSLVLSIEEEFDLMPSNFRSIAAIGRLVELLGKPR